MGKRATHYVYKDKDGEWQIKECEWRRKLNRWIDRAISMTAILIGLAALILRLTR